MIASLVGVASLAPAETERGVVTTPPGESVPFKTGRQYLVVIAVSQYEQWSPLASPVKDAREIKDILLSRYRIDRLFELYDKQATKANILRLLVRLQQEIKVDDSLLILYAGHGHLDRSSSIGFWIPANAGIDIYEQQNWLPHTQLRGLLANFKAAHLFVISDSCFAGDLIQATRSLPDAANPEFLQKAYAQVCRQVLTSGATEAVPDTSDFARQLKAVLGSNRNPYLDTFTLYNDVRVGVSSSVPLLGSLAGTGHQEGASFLLFLRPELIQPPDESMPPGASEPGRSEGVSTRVNRFSAAAGYGWAFPVGQTVEAVGYAQLVWASGYYNLCRDWGNLGFGLLAGALWLSSADSSLDSYGLASFPLAAELRYQTGSARAPNLSLGLAAGAAFSQILYDNPAFEDHWVAKPLLVASLGIAVRVFRRFQIVASAKGLIIFFDNNPYTGVSTEVGVEYAF